MYIWSSRSGRTLEEWANPKSSFTENYGKRLICRVHSDRNDSIVIFLFVRDAYTGRTKK